VNKGTDPGLGHPVRCNQVQASRREKRLPKKKKVKDLDPKAKAKKVKGGRTNLNRHIGNTENNVLDAAGNTINRTGGAFNRALNPPS
jgi:hypothetical protein